MAIATSRGSRAIVTQRYGGCGSGNQTKAASVARSASPAVRSAHATWRSSSTASGQAATSLARTSGSTRRPGLVCIPSTSVESLARASAALAASHSATMRSANGTSSLPARLNRAPVDSRANSETRSWRSSARICLESFVSGSGLTSPFA